MKGALAAAALLLTGAAQSPTASVAPAAPADKAAAKPAGLDPPAWTEPTAPFRIVGNVYYVGTRGLAAYLIRASDGRMVLIDGTMEENAPAIERSIAALGFRLSDVKLLLNSHAHFDHAAGLARLQRDTGARLLASAGDAPALRTGVPPSEVSYGVVRFPLVRVDGTLTDGRPVRLGDVALVPAITPGHTPGCTTWSTTAVERGRTLRVLFPCSLTVAGNRLVGNPGYPGIVADFRRSFARMAAMDADAVLPAHPELTDVLGRAERAKAGDAGAWSMPGTIPAMVASARTAFDAALAKEQAARR